MGILKNMHLMESKQVFLCSQNFKDEKVSQSDGTL